MYLFQKGAKSERLRGWSNKPDVVGSIPVTTEFFLLSCDSNQVSKWFGTHFNLVVPLFTFSKMVLYNIYCSAWKSVFGVTPAKVQWVHYVAYV